MTPRTPPTLRTRLTGLLATVTIVGIVVGLPAVLLALGSIPIPHGLPDADEIGRALASPDDGTLLLGLIQVVAWVAWLFLAASILGEIVARLRGVRAPRLPGLQLPQSAARGLVAAAVLLFAASPVIGVTPASAAATMTQPTRAGVGATAPAVGGFTTVTTAAWTAAPGIASGSSSTTRTPADRTSAGGPDDSSAGSTRPDGRPAVRPNVVEHRVSRGETLWSIAESRLGDGSRYPQIIALNRDLLGSNPGFLAVGEVIHLPVPAVQPARPARPAQAIPFGVGPQVRQDRQDTGVEAVTVDPGDTLSEIALDYLGDAGRFGEVFDASRDIVQPDGRRLSDPDLIRPGWQLRIPTPRVPTEDGPQDRAQPGVRVEPDRTPGSAGTGAAPGPGASAPPATPAATPLATPAATPAATPLATPLATPSVTSAPSGLSTPSPPSGPASTNATRSTPPVSTSAVHSAPTGANDSGDTDPQPETADSAELAPWVLAGLSGAGVLLAGSMLLVLRRRRRSQFRARRPGRTIATPEPVLAPVEKTLTSLGGPASADVEFMDQALRRLATAATESGSAVPDLAAVELGRHVMTLHFAEPTELPLPWRRGVDAMRWSLPAGVELDDVADERPDQPAPFPLLVVVGSSDAGEVWLLNLEDLTVRITGDTEFGQDFARHLVGEIACNPWSHGVRVDLVGVGVEAAAMNTDRITLHATLPGTTAATDPGDILERLAAEAVRDAVTVIDRSTEAGCNVPTARAAMLGAETWPARLLLTTSTTATSATSTPTPALDRLVDLVASHPGQSATAVVVHEEATGDPLGAREGLSVMELQFTADGRVNLPQVGLNLVAVGLTGDEARGCAALLQQSEVLDDEPMPVDASATEGWRAWSDEAGALRPEFTVPRRPHTTTSQGAADDDAGRRGGSAGGDVETGAAVHTMVTSSHGGTAAHEARRVGATPVTATTPLTEAAAESVLDRDDEDYLRAAATTPEDLAVLAPKVELSVRARVVAADPTLDGDLAAWWDVDCRRPRLTLLGPVAARTRGTPVTKRKPYWTEMLAYLATRPHGATPDELADAFTITPGKAREYVRIVREWLGTNPATGELHLPDARQAPAARDRGVGVYQVLDVLVDADLFRRLRLRGESRGPDGISDLRQALRLVQGRPFDRLRVGGWAWLYEGDRLDQHMTCAIVDVAHLVTVHSLQAGDTRSARLSAETAALAAPDEEIPRLDLAAVADAEGHHALAQQILRDDVANRTDDDSAPADLPRRTQQILDRRAG